MFVCYTGYDLTLWTSVRPTILLLYMEILLLNKFVCFTGYDLTSMDICSSYYSAALYGNSESWISLLQRIWSDSMDVCPCYYSAALYGNSTSWIGLFVSQDMIWLYGRLSILLFCCFIFISEILPSGLKCSFCFSCHVYIL